MTVNSNQNATFNLVDGKFVARTNVKGTHAVSLVYNGKTYTTNLTLNDQDVGGEIEVTKTKLNGSVGGYNSFVDSRKVVSDVDDVKICYYDYTYQNAVQGTRYYLKTNVRATDTNNNFVGIMAAVYNGDLGGAGREKLIIGIRNDNNLAYNYGGSWSWGTYNVIKDVSSILGSDKYNYSLAVYRDGADFAIFVNDVYVTTLTIGMFEKCGFGLGSQASTAEIYFTDYIYSFNEELLDDIEKNVWGNVYNLNTVIDNGHIVTGDGKAEYFHDITYDLQTKITVQFANSQGTVVKTVLTANRNMNINLPAGDYTVTSTFKGTSANTVKTTTLSVSKNREFSIDLPLTQLGGSANGVSSFGQFYTYPSSDSISMTNNTYSFVTGVTGSSYYIEGTFRKNVQGWVGFIMNTNGANAPSGGNNMIVFAVYNGGTLFYKPSTANQWNCGVNDGSIPTPVNNSYRMGVLRLNQDYYVFIDGALFKKYHIPAYQGKEGNVGSDNKTVTYGTYTELPANNVSGFGLFRGNNFQPAANIVTDIKWSNNPAVFAQVLGGVSVGEIANGVTVKNGSTTLSSGSVVASGTTLTLTVSAPAGEKLSALNVNVGGIAQNLTVSGENTYTFTTTHSGQLNVIADYEVIKTAQGTLSYRSAYLNKGNTSYDMYDISDVTPSQVSATLTNVYTGEKTNVTFSDKTATVSIPTGKYKVTYYYANNEMTEYLDVNGNFEYAGQISKAYLGGSITFKTDSGCTNSGCPGQTGADITLLSYNHAAVGSVSGGAWALLDGDKGAIRNAISLTGYSFALQDKVVSDTIYVEGKFDTSVSSVGADHSSTLGGLMVAHGRDDLHDTHTNSYKLAVGVRGETLFVNDFNNGWDSSKYQIIANLRARGMLENSPIVKVGVARVGNKFYIYANDEFITCYVYTKVSKSSGVGVASVGASKVQIRDFNYSTNADLVNSPVVTETKDIDVFFIAGQSNASGYTKFAAQQLENMDSRMIYGFDNIWYAGNSRDGTTTAVNNVRNFTLARAGLGKTNDFMACEPALAQVLSEYYNPETGKNAALIKYGAGGTSLLDSYVNGSACEGNWMSPSYITYKNATNPLAGGLYRNFIAEATKRLGELKAMGYNPIIKGLYWMQGCQDMGSPAEYKIDFKYFASDIRKDITTISGQNCANMPIFVGELSSTYASATTSTMDTMSAFIAMQNTLDDENANVHILPFSQFKINETNDNGATSYIAGSDQYHFNYIDHLKMGEILGKAIVNVVLN